MFNGISQAQAKNLESLAIECGLGALNERLYQLAQNSICLLGLEPENYLHKGNCRIGGIPDVPAGFSWPEEMSFIAQIKLGQIAPCDQNQLLPDSGMLYFFLGSDEQTQILPMHVSWANVPTAELAAAAIPRHYKSVKSDEYEGGDTNVIYEPFRLSFKPCISLPAYGSRHYDELLGEEPGEKEIDDYSSLLDKLEIERPTKRTGYNRLLGYASVSGAGEDPDVLACASSRGIDADFYRFDLKRIDELIEELERRSATDSHANYLLELRRKQRNQLLNMDSATVEEFRKEVDDWILLFELDSDFNCGMNFWDAGRIDFMIRKKDLVERKFDQVRAFLFSS